MQQKWVSEFKAIIRKTELIHYLKALQQARIPNAWLCAGVVRNTVWKELFGDKCSLEINDIDVPYFSKELSMEMNKTFSYRLEELYPTGRWECDNQALVHLYEPRTDYYHPHAPYNSIEESMTDFWFTVNTIAIRLNEKDEIEILHPEVLEDLFRGILRPTATSKTNPYPWLEERINKIVSKCPDIKVVR